MGAGDGQWPGTSVQESVLLLDEPAGAAILAACEFLRQQGLLVTHQSAYSVAFAAVDGARSPTLDGEGSPSAGQVQPQPPYVGAGQIASVPVQVRPEWCRVWVTVNGHGAVVAVAEAYVAMQRERSARVAVAVQELERGVYDESRWPAYAATLRATLQRQGLVGAVLEAKLTAWKKRWLALGRKAAASPEDG